VVLKDCVHTSRAECVIREDYDSFPLALHFRSFPVRRISKQHAIIVAHIENSNGFQASYAPGGGGGGGTYSMICQRGAYEWHTR
jgi:hypothetical protein